MAVVAGGLYAAVGAVESPASSSARAHNIGVQSFQPRMREETPRNLPCSDIPTLSTKSLSREVGTRMGKFNHTKARPTIMKIINAWVVLGFVRPGMRVAAAKPPCTDHD